MPEGPDIIAIEGVSKVFRSGANPIHALSDTSLRIGKGQFICLIGASGCGKSTLLRLIGGFEAPTHGRVRMWDADVAGPGPDRGMVFQDYALFPWLTVRGNIAFGPKARGLYRKEVAATTDRFMEMVGLTKFAEAYPHQLSGGMKQRVAIARVLANDAQVILMDEPFGALDAMTRERLQEELLELWQRTGLTVVFVTHAIEEAILLADRVVVMTPGPGRIQSDNSIALARPRDVASPDFNAVRRQLSHLLVSHHGSKAAPAPSPPQLRALA
jgi:NitT/TauT family transport system ATP-binding protein